MSRLVSDIVKALEKKGFFSYNNDHMRFRYITLSGRKTGIQTKISFGIKEVDKGTFSAIGRQIHLSKDVFADYVKCTVGQPEYEAILIKNGNLKEVEDGENVYS